MVSFDDARRGGRRGFSLVELLVVVAVIGVLTALLLAAVHRVREAANRTACANNIRQLAFAALNFHNSQERFPPAAVTRPTLQGWGSYLLPYLDQQALFRAYDPGANWFDPVNGPAVATPLKIFQCPSAPPGRTQAGSVRGVAWSAAAGDYGPIRAVNSNLTDTGLVPDTDDRRGVMRVDEATTMADITDGSSTTLLLAECAGRPQRWKMGRLVSGQVSRGAGWADSGNSLVLNGFDPQAGTPVGPCAVNCTNDQQVYGFHPAGANVALADGSARLIGAGVSIRTFAALVTRAGQEIVAAGEF